MSRAFKNLSDALDAASDDDWVHYSRATDVWKLVHKDEPEAREWAARYGYPQWVKHDA